MMLSFVKHWLHDFCLKHRVRLDTDLTTESLIPDSTSHVRHPAKIDDSVAWLDELQLWLIIPTHELVWMHTYAQHVKLARVAWQHHNDRMVNPRLHSRHTAIVPPFAQCLHAELLDLGQKAHNSHDRAEWDLESLRGFCCHSIGAWLWLWRLLHPSLINYLITDKVQCRAAIILCSIFL